MELTKLWIAILTTRNEPTSGAAGTDNAISLIINIDGQDRYNEQLPKTRQRDQKQGAASLYEIDVAGRGILADDLTDSSFRISILGRDAWRPEHIFIWGKVARRITLEPEIIPLAIETNITLQLSNDPQEGEASIPLRLVDLGSNRMNINRLFMLIVTGGSGGGGGEIIAHADPASNFGTTSLLEIQVVNDKNLVVLSEIKKTFQSDLRENVANFYAAPVFTSFQKRNLDNRSITLRLKGLDDWTPTRLFIFGLDDASGRPEAMIPLVHLPVWPHGTMVADSLTGNAERVLRLAPSPIDLLGELNELAKLRAF